MLLYADDIIIFSETADGLQRGLDILKDYCDKWRLIVNTNKTKVMIFRKGGTLRRNLNFKYDNKDIEIVKKFTYLGVVLRQGVLFMKHMKHYLDRLLRLYLSLKHVLIS